MDQKEVQHILIDILYATINERDDYKSIKEKITPDCLLDVYRLAKKHDLAHVVSNFVYRAKIKVEQELQAILQREEIMSIYRYEQMKYAFEIICASFDEEGIAYIPLKGSVIRPYYPYESMRTSCDIDILIHEHDIEVAIKCLESKGYRCGDKHYHDVSLYSPNKIHLELHFNIQENIDSLDSVLKNAWQYATLTKGSRYDFEKEFLVYYFYAHMAYHFLSGGCGIRSLLDIWVMEHKMKVTYLCARELLDKAGIYKFATEISKIADKCFSENTEDVFSDPVLKYIFSGGVYGSSENNIAVYKTKKNSSFLYLIERLFLPYNSMKVSYPILKKAPYLLPFCWIVRWIKALFGGKSKRIVSEVNCANNVSSERVKEVAAICSRLGL